MTSCRNNNLLFAVLAFVWMLGASMAASAAPHELVLQAEAERIATIEKATAATLAIMAPGGQAADRVSSFHPMATRFRTTM